MYHFYAGELIYKLLKARNKREKCQLCVSFFVENSMRNVAIAIWPVQKSTESKCEGATFQAKSIFPLRARSHLEIILQIVILRHILALRIRFSVAFKWTMELCHRRSCNWYVNAVRAHEIIFSTIVTYRLLRYSLDAFTTSVWIYEKHFSLFSFLPPYLPLSSPISLPIRSGLICSVRIVQSSAIKLWPIE